MCPVEFDVFICHASEDKESFVRPLAKTLRNANIKVWYDESSLSWGDSLTESISAGLARCSFGIVVFSPAFFAKQWTKWELEGLQQRQMAEKRKVILPIYHNISSHDVLRHLPSLAGAVAIRSDEDIETVVKKLKTLLGQSKQLSTQVKKWGYRRDRTQPITKNSSRGKRFSARTSALEPKRPLALWFRVSTIFASNLTYISLLAYWYSTTLPSQKMPAIHDSPLKQRHYKTAGNYTGAIAENGLPSDAYVSGSTGSSPLQEGAPTGRLLPPEIPDEVLSRESDHIFRKGSHYPFCIPSSVKIRMSLSAFHLVYPKALYFDNSFHLLIDKGPWAQIRFSFDKFNLLEDIVLAARIESSTLEKKCIHELGTDFTISSDATILTWFFLIKDGTTHGDRLVLDSHSAQIEIERH